MNCRVPTAVGFKTKLEFNQYDIRITKDQSVLTKILKLFAKHK